MVKCLVVMLIGMLVSANINSAEASVRMKSVQLQQAEVKTIQGSIKGGETVDYQLSAAAGESLSVDFRADNRSAYFNLLPPASEEAVFIGSTSGDHCSVRITRDGIYTIRVYLMRNAARRNEKAGYQLKIAVNAPAQLFTRRLELQGIGFLVASANSGSTNTVRIIPSGLEIDNGTIVRNIDGTVAGAEVADLDGNGSPEVYLYITSAGSGSYGSLMAYAANRRKSLSEIYLPPLEQHDPAADGYRGHDEFAILEGVLGRRFPLYRDTDTNARATGGMRQLQYRLYSGEAGWALRMDRMFDF